MDLIPLTIGIARPVGKAKQIKSGTGSPASASSVKIDPELKKKILERDNHTCRGCGFKSEKYQEIHFLNNNKADMSEKNLATTCIYCHQIFNLQDVSRMKSGALIWLPEIEQHELHHIARAIYVAQISQGPVADAARKANDIILERRNEAAARLGIDDPYMLSMVMQDYLNDRQYMRRKEKLEGIRLWPLNRRIIKEADLEFNQFPQILAYWRSKNGPFGGKTPPKWIELYQELLGKAEAA